MTQFAYDPSNQGGGANAWADLNWNNTLQTRRFYLDGVDQLFARLSATGTAAWYLTDHLGSVRALLDGNGAVQDQITYDGYGNIANETNSNFGDRYKFNGREWDAPINLQYNRARYYNPLDGIWMSQDPIGFDGGDSNLYRYVGNDPTNFGDPSGQKKPGLIVSLDTAKRWVDILEGWGVHSKPYALPAADDGTQRALIRVSDSVSTAEVLWKWHFGGAWEQFFYDHIYETGWFSNPWMLGTFDPDQGVTRLSTTTLSAREQAAINSIVEAENHGSNVVIGDDGSYHARPANQVDWNPFTIPFTNLKRAGDDLVAESHRRSEEARIEREKRYANGENKVKVWIEQLFRSPDSDGNQLIMGLGGVAAVPGGRAMRNYTRSERLINKRIDRVSPIVDGAPAMPNAPEIPPGSAGGQGAGRRIPRSLRDQHFPEGQSPPTCGYCRQDPAGDLDHVIPRSQNGDLTPQNILPACPHCNRSKGARPAPVSPPATYVGEWPPSWWPQNMIDWWNQAYGGSGQ